MSKSITLPARTTVPAGVAWLRTRGPWGAAVVLVDDAGADVAVAPVEEDVGADVVVVVVAAAPTEKQAQSRPARWNSLVARWKVLPVTSGTGLPPG
jgi:hypothetical protein